MTKGNTGLSKLAGFLQSCSWDRHADDSGFITVCQSANGLNAKQNIDGVVRTSAIFPAVQNIVLSVHLCRQGLTSKTHFSSRMPAIEVDARIDVVFLETSSVLPLSSAFGLPLCTHFEGWRFVSIEKALTGGVRLSCHA